MSHPNKGGGFSDDTIRYPPQPSGRPRPRQVWGGEGSGGEQSFRTHSYGNSSVPGEPVEVHSVNANGMLLAGQGQYGISPEAPRYPLLARKFEEAVEQNEELQIEIGHLKKCCTDYIGEADKAVKDMKARHKTQLNQERTRAKEMQKLYEDTLKQYEDAKIVVLSYKSKNIELEGHNRGLVTQLDDSRKAVQRGASGSPRELERMRREIDELRRDNQACMVALQLKDEDLREMCDKRDVYKKSYQQAADERDNLAAQVTHLQRKLADLDSSSNKKEATALRMRLQESQVSNVGLQDQVKRLQQEVRESRETNVGLQEQLRDLQQQLQSASAGSMLQQQEAQGITADLEKRYEQDLLMERKQVLQWKGECQLAEDRVRSTQEEVEVLKDERAVLQITVNGLKKALDAKEDDIRDLKAQKSVLESRGQDQSAFGHPSTREADQLTRQLAEKERIVQDLTMQLTAKNLDLQLAEDQQRTAEDKVRHLEMEVRQLEEKEHALQDLKAQLKQKETSLKESEDKVAELKQQSQSTGRAEPQSPTSPRATIPAMAPNPTQTRQTVSLMKQLEEKVMRVKELEQECEHLQQKIVDLSSELRSSNERIEDLDMHLRSKEDDLRESKEHQLRMNEELRSVKERLDIEHESLQRLQYNHQQEMEQLLNRAEQAEARFKDYRLELKQHAQALKRVSQELQGERYHHNKLQTELDTSRQEVQALEKCQRELKDEQSTSNLLREQLKQYVSDFQMEKQGHQRTVQDKVALDQRVKDLERENRHLKQQYDSRQAQPLGHLYKVDSQDEPARLQGGRHDQFTEFARVTPPMYQTANRPGSAAQVPKAAGIQPPGGGTTRDPTGVPQHAFVNPLPHGGGAPQDPKGAVGEDPAARRHPCPICGRTFPDLQKLERHASNCNGN